jgi:type II restriction/modification system DNA methylase subunit YeeA
MNDEGKPAAVADPDFIIHHSSFIPDANGIVPMMAGEWFRDNINIRLREFLRVTFGEATLKQNLRFIEDSLGKPLAKYFLTDFYRDHLQTYKKRPIYWLFQSPKKGFSALVYLHRYTKDTVNTLLNSYLRDFLKKLETRIAHLVEVEATATANKDKTAARKEREQLQKTLKECQDWERDVILPLAQQRLEIDLDDGVKTNYPKFGKALVPIPGLAVKGD